MFQQRRLKEGTLRPFLRKMEAVNMQSMQNKQYYRFDMGNDFARLAHKPNETFRNTVSFFVDLKTKR